MNPKIKVSFANWEGLSLSAEGLTEQEVSRQRAQYGLNTIAESGAHPWRELALETVRDPMLWFLVGVGSLFLWLGEISDGITLFVAILPLVLMDAFLHWRTKASTQNLKGSLISRLRVLREGRQFEIDSRELVPGDLVELGASMILPADGVFEFVEELQIDESVLTGEAFPIRKQSIEINELKKNHLSAETFILASAIGSAGTRVLAGRGRLRILKIGEQTNYGQIVLAVSRMPQERTPLQVEIARMVARLIYAAGALCLLLAGVRAYQGFGWIDAILSSATLAVAAIPEEFPVVLTFFLGVGIYRLAQKKALVRRAVAVESIGRTTWICTDKTGTLTVGELKLTHIDPGPGMSALQVLEVVFPICSEESQDPIDLAIRQKSLGENFKLPPIRARFPFTEDRKKESVICEVQSTFWCLTKGAPETILSLTGFNEQQARDWLTRTSDWARQGHKVLAVARQRLSAAEQQVLTEPQSSFEFCGLLAFEDPFRPEVPEAIAYCRDHDIRVLMMTGDHPETAKAIARDIGLIVGETDRVSGSSESLTLQDLKVVDVVARCTPMQKLRIVETLKKSGEIVAVTGDGVNDVPALKVADIGIAMGLRGTRSAREVSSIILADDNFRSIVSAIREGRKLFAALKMSFAYLLLIHIPFVATAAFIPLAGYPLVYLPVHIVWMELIIHPTAILGFHDLESDSQDRPAPGLFKPSQGWWLTLIGLTVATVLVFLFISGAHESQGIPHARAKALAFLISWSACLLAALTGLRTLRAAVVFVLTLSVSALLIQTEAFSVNFGLTPLHLRDWLEILISTAFFSAVTRWSKAL